VKLPNPDFDPVIILHGPDHRIEDDLDGVSHVLAGILLEKILDLLQLNPFLSWELHLPWLT